MGGQELKFAPLEISADNIFLTLENAVESRAGNTGFFGYFRHIDRVIIVLLKESEEGIDELILGVGFHGLRRKAAFCRK